MSSTFSGLCTLKAKNAEEIQRINEAIGLNPRSVNEKLLNSRMVCDGKQPIDSSYD